MHGKDLAVEDHPDPISRLELIVHCVRLRAERDHEVTARRHLQLCLRERAVGGEGEDLARVAEDLEDELGLAPDELDAILYEHSEHLRRRARVATL